MIRRLASNGRLSQAVVANGFVFVSGQATEEPQKNVADQMRDALAGVDAALGQAGTDKSRIVLANIVLADISDYGQMNEVWDAWVDREAPPARTCHEARVSAKPYLVEVSVIAATA